MLKRKRETKIVEKFMELFDLLDIKIKTIALYFDIPYMYLVYIDTDKKRVKFVSQVLQHRTGLGVSKDQTIINANDYYKKIINGNL